MRQRVMDDPVERDRLARIQLMASSLWKFRDRRKRRVMVDRWVFGAIVVSMLILTAWALFAVRAGLLKTWGIG